MMYKKYIIAGLTSILLVFYFTFDGFAQNTTHEVQKGETLFSIAKQYEVSVQQLREWNNLDSNELKPGQALIVRTDNTDRSQNEDVVTHKVQKQETLFSISKQYGVTIAEIKSWNNLENNNLNIGQELMIYPSDTDRQPKQSIVTDQQVQDNAYYTVKSGDTLYKIASEHNMTVDELKQLNGLTTDNISVGQRLTVRKTSAPPSVAENASSSPQGKFITYRVSSGSENLQQILRKFEMDEIEFRALNPSIKSETFQKGQQLTVLAPPNRTYENPYRTNASLQDLGSTSATRYSSSEKGNPTTNGELYNPNALTAAHPNISLGTIIFVQNPENKRGVYVRINDRNSGSGIKLSETAWNALQISSSNPTVNIFQD